MLFYLQMVLRQHWLANPENKVEADWVPKSEKERRSILPRASLAINFEPIQRMKQQNLMPLSLSALLQLARKVPTEIGQEITRLQAKPIP